MARLRVVFDANYSRTRRLERSLIRNPQNPQSLKLYKAQSATKRTWRVRFPGTPIGNRTRIYSLGESCSIH